MVNQLIPMALLALAAGAALTVGLAIFRRRSGQEFARAWGSAALDVALLLTAATIAVLTLPPGLEDHRVADLVPFRDITRALRQTSFSDTQLWAMVGNVLLFVPVGALAPLRFPRVDGWVRILLLCAGISTAIEVFQFVVGTHSATTDDVLVNTVGGVLGYLSMRGIRAMIRKRARPKAAAS